MPPRNNRPVLTTTGRSFYASGSTKRFHQRDSCLYHSFTRQAFDSNHLNGIQVLYPQPALGLRAKLVGSIPQRDCRRFSRRFLILRT